MSGGKQAVEVETLKRCQLASFRKDFVFFSVLSVSSVVNPIPPRSWVRFQDRKYNKNREL